jgi:hypothetical protein
MTRAEMAKSDPKLALIRIETPATAGLAANIEAASLPRRAGGRNVACSC